MVELKEKANNYAEENVVNVLKEAFAKVYADGYRDGYKDREEEVPVDLRNNKTEYVDLGLPSGTLWAANYEYEYRGKTSHFKYFPYDKAVLYDIPTIEQWNELIKTCKWEHVASSTGTVFRIDCTGRNGNVISFRMTGLINAIQQNKANEAFFWIKEDLPGVGNDKSAVHMYRKFEEFGNDKIPCDIRSIDRFFSGFKLPIRLVKKK